MLALLAVVIGAWYFDRLRPAAFLFVIVLAGAATAMALYNHSVNAAQFGEHPEYGTGLIAQAYGLTLTIHAAVFAAAWLAFRAIRKRRGGSD